MYLKQFKKVKTLKNKFILLDDDCEETGEFIVDSLKTLTEDVIPSLNPQDGEQVNNLLSHGDYQDWVTTQKVADEELHKDSFLTVLNRLEIFLFNFVTKEEIFEMYLDLLEFNQDLIKQKRDFNTILQYREEEIEDLKKELEKSGHHKDTITVDNYELTKEVLILRRQLKNQ